MELQAEEMTGSYRGRDDVTVRAVLAFARLTPEQPDRPLTNWEEEAPFLSNSTQMRL